ncbi:MAG: hypothetical protein EBR82_66510, partial [Caulobacteraceae bacterium]|nr:hypothetical protein [Caulobacteraceae bacterium]
PTIKTKLNMYNEKQIAEIARLRKQRKALFLNDSNSFDDEEILCDVSLRLFQLTGHRGYLLGVC